MEKFRLPAERQSINQSIKQSFLYFLQPAPETLSKHLTTTTRARQTKGATNEGQRAKRGKQEDKKKNETTTKPKGALTHHEKQLDQVLVDRHARGLDDVHVFAPHVLLHHDIHLAVRETVHLYRVSC